MITLNMITVLMVAVSMFAFLSTAKKGHELSPYFLLLFFGSGLLLRMVLGYHCLGYESDTACFTGWADRVYSVGFGEFYSPDVFTDYPPGYMYVLYILGMIRSVFEIPTYSGIHLMMTKMPAIICDVICSYIIYHEAKRHFPFQSQAMIISSVYLFNPAVILNSSVWGQVDSIYALGIILLCLFITNGKLIPAYITFGIGVLVKPQTLIFTPILIAGIIDYVFLQGFDVKNFFRNLFSGLAVIFGMFLAILPFGLENVLAQYFDTLESYPYISLYAFNVWTLFGKNLASQYDMLLFLSYKNWGTIFLICIVILTLVLSILLGKNNNKKYFALAAFLILSVFHFSVRMHERYMYVALILVLFCYLYKPIKPLFICYVGLSVFHWYNTGFVLLFDPSTSPDNGETALSLISAGNVFFLIMFYFILLRYYLKETGYVKSKKTAK